MPIQELQVPINGTLALSSSRFTDATETNSSIINRYICFKLSTVSQKELKSQARLTIHLSIEVGIIFIRVSFVFPSNDVFSNNFLKLPFISTSKTLNSDVSANVK